MRTRERERACARATHREIHRPRETHCNAHTKQTCSSKRTSAGVKESDKKKRNKHAGIETCRSEGDGTHWPVLEGGGGVRERAVAWCVFGGVCARERKQDAYIYLERANAKVTERG